VRAAGDAGERVATPLGPGFAFEKPWEAPMAFVRKWLILLSEIPIMDALTLGIFVGK
jgi:hypothetical protein